jgi:arabinogalactan oligomer / maltooligosaccharide transport system permease protein
MASPPVDLAALFSLFPVVWIISASFNAVDNLSGATLIPRQVTLENFTSLFTEPRTSRWAPGCGTRWKVAVIAAVPNVLLASLAAYAFSRLKFKGRRAGLLTLLLYRCSPSSSGSSPCSCSPSRSGRCSRFRPRHPPVPDHGLHGRGHRVQRLPHQGFMDTIPVSLDESARVDGAGPSAIFFRIVLPLSRPVLAVIFIITFINLYSEFILARFLLSSTEQFTLAVGLQLFVQSEYTAKWGQLTGRPARCAADRRPPSWFAQKQIIGGLTQGSVKGGRRER